jgi:flagellar motility protein MotE (MotC chaperone)
VELPPPKQSEAPVQPAPTLASAAPVPDRPAPQLGDPLADQYCKIVLDAATQARLVEEKRALADMEKDLEGRVVLLEKKTAEYKDWLKKRDVFMAQARDNIVQIYSRMKSEAAAAQLVALNEEVAAAIVAKLDVKLASAVMSDMDPPKAARLTALMAAAAEITERAPTAASKDAAK